jgi:hypothetical protein
MPEPQPLAFGASQALFFEMAAMANKVDDCGIGR